MATTIYLNEETLKMLDLMKVEDKRSRSKIIWILIEKEFEKRAKERKRKRGKNNG